MTNQKELPFSEPIDLSIRGEILAHRKALSEVENPTMLHFVREEGQRQLGETVLLLWKIIESSPKERAIALLLKEFGLE